MAHHSDSASRWVVVTVKGKAAAIVQDAGACQRLLDLAVHADFGKALEGLEDVKEGRVRSAREFFAEFEARHDLRR